MEVMDTRELEQSEVLIGQQGKAQSMGVSDDAMLMSMLSTGLYKYPLRTMLQEIMFNAWDAHHMGNCQDKPFDIYINTRSGIVVRDYGPGIAPDQMQPIYCVYGNSTKRNDSGSTGGFGLGSKSPFAYTDSFMVTSMHNGKKSMYSMMKVSDDNDGKPGMVPIIQNVDTDESGLTVTVPLKTSDDMTKAIQYIDDIAHLSGMKFNLHVDFGDENPQTQLYECEALPDGAFTFVDRNSYKNNGHIYAVYGGVKYEIERDDEYREQYDFLYRMSKVMGVIFLGFAPNTLTPTPSREGLNFSDKTKESIQSAVEKLEESIRILLRPVIRMVFTETLNIIDDLGLPRIFIDNAWSKAGNTALKNLLYTYADPAGFIQENNFFKSPEFQKLVDRCPEGSNKYIWESLIKWAFTHTESLVSLAGLNQYLTMSLVHFKKYGDPEARKMLVRLNDRNRTEDSFFTSYRKDRFKELIDIQKQVSDLVEKPVDIRVCPDEKDRWVVTKNTRGAGKIRSRRMSEKRSLILKALMADKKLTLPDTPYPDRLWCSSDGSEIVQTMYEKTILVAKTVASLNETPITTQNLLCRMTAPENKRILHRRMSDFIQIRNYSAFPAMVVPKGKYDDVVAFLRDSGWIVHEGVEVEKKQPALPLSDEVEEVKPEIPMWETFAKSTGYSLRFGEFIERPKIFMHMTDTDLERGSYRYRHILPENDFVSAILEYQPALVRLTNKAQERKIRSLGAVSVNEWVDKRVNKLAENEDRYMLLLMYAEIIKQSHFPEEVIAIPEMQKFLGIPYLRTRQSEIFHRDRQFLSAVFKDRTSFVWDETKSLMNKMKTKYVESPHYSDVTRIIQNSTIFDERALKGKVSTKRGENKVLVEKLIRFLRTV